MLLFEIQNVEFYEKSAIFYAKSPEINLAPSPAEQAVHGGLFTFDLRTFGYRLLLTHWSRPEQIFTFLFCLLCLEVFIAQTFDFARSDVSQSTN